MNTTTCTITPSGGKMYAFEIPAPASGDGSNCYFAASNGVPMAQPSTGMVSQPPCGDILQSCEYCGGPPPPPPPAGGYLAMAAFVPKYLPASAAEKAWLGPFCDFQTGKGKFTGALNAGNQWFAVVATDPTAPSAVILVVG